MNANHSLSLFSRFKNRAFTILELLVVISIISLLASLSVPSLLNYIHFLRLRSFREDVISDINYLVSASQKYGGNCNVQLKQLRTNTRPDSRFAASLKCFQNSIQLQIDNSSSNFIPLDSNDMFLLANSPSIQVGNHGALVGPNDYLIIVGFRPSFGADTKPLCFTMTRYSSSVKLGTYNRNVSNLPGPYISKISPSLNPIFCS